jgi:hypothetical protein
VSSGNVAGHFMPAAGDGTFNAPTQTLALRSRTVTTGQLNAHPGTDLVAMAGSSSTTIDLFLSVASGPFAARQSLTASGAVRALSVADLDGDGLQDVVAATARTIQYFGGNGDGTFRPRATVLSFTSASIEAFAVGDLTLDGRPDLVVKRDTATGDLRVHTALAPAVFDATPRAVIDFGEEAQGVFIADLNGDGRLDVGVHARSGGITRYGGLGNGGLSDLAINDPPYDGYYAVAVVDLDGALGVDTVAMDFDHPVVLLQGTQPVSYGVGVDSRESELAVGDFTGDGRPDVLVQGRTTRDLRLLVGTCR